MNVNHGTWHTSHDGHRKFHINQNLGVGLLNECLQDISSKSKRHVRPLEKWKSIKVINWNYINLNDLFEENFIKIIIFLFIMLSHWSRRPRRHRNNRNEKKKIDGHTARFHFCSDWIIQWQCQCVRYTLSPVSSYKLKQYGEF